METSNDTEDPSFRAVLTYLRITDYFSRVETNKPKQLHIYISSNVRNQSSQKPVRSESLKV